MPYVYASNLSASDFYRCVIFAFLVDFMVSVGFEPLAEHLFSIVMVMRLGCCDRGIAEKEQTHNRNRGREETWHTIHVHN
jgi:hypothetical protein